MSPTVRLALAPRNSFASWQRDRQVQIFAELSALRQDRARLIRQSTKVARCESCRVLRSVSIQESGFYLCNRCADSAKEASA